MFKYDNGCSVFLSYNFFSILKESNITQSRLSLDMFRAVTEKFFIEYHQDLSAIPPLANTLVQFCCHSLSNQNPEHYVCCQKAKVSSNKLCAAAGVLEVLLKESGCEYAKHDVDLRREDRRGNHPTIDVLGDYDVIGLNTTQKRIFIIECKVLQPIGSVFEHSNQQKRFFTKEKFDEKFQKRIDYFSKVAMSFFANHGYDTEGFTINPYMVVNKVFSSYYKHVQFPIVTFDELKREIQL